MSVATARPVVRWAGLLALAAVFALALGGWVASIGQNRVYFAVAVCLMPVVPLLMLHTRTAAMVALALLPLDLTVLSGAADGINVGVVDLLLAVALVGAVLALNAHTTARRQLAVLRPLHWLIAVYFAASVVSFVANPSLNGVVALVQRFELVVLPLLIGVLIFTDRSARIGLILFAVTALVLGAAFVLPHSSTSGVLGVGKNGGGQYIADAALITLSVFVCHRLRFYVFPVFIVAAYATQSRGALIGLAAGLVVFIALRSRDLVQALVRAIPLVAVLVALFLILPTANQSQILSDTESTARNDQLRVSFLNAAWNLYAKNPFVGVGIGNYFSGNVSIGDQTNDPHNVLILEAAVGGTLLLGAFLVLQLGALIVVFRRRKSSPWAIPALCVQVSILVHAQVDVYWVRGTPVIGWLLIGLALAPLGQIASARRVRQSELPQASPELGRVVA